jgi:putative aldouronate transport system substrate-binding protein
VILIVLIMGLLPSCSNKLGSDKDKVSNKEIDVTILTTGFVNTPTDNNDPFKKWVKDKYGINLTLFATNDFATLASVKFNSNQMPDIISLPSLQMLRTYYDQGIFIPLLSGTR